MPRKPLYGHDVMLNATVRIPGPLLVKGRRYNLNVSEICRRALNASVLEAEERERERRGRRSQPVKRDAYDRYP